MFLIVILLIFLFGLMVTVWNYQYNKQKFILRVKYLLNVWMESRKNKPYWDSSINQLVLDYHYDEKPYKIIIPTLSEETDSFFSTKPEIVQSKCINITDIDGHNVHVKFYFGPSLYSNYLTPKMLGYPELVLHYEDNSSKMFMENDLMTFD
jgi:hypothetical protein